MPWALAASAVIGAGGALIGGERASDEAMTGYDYAVDSPLHSEYLPAGAEANSQIRALLLGGQGYVPPQGMGGTPNLGVVQQPVAGNINHSSVAGGAPSYTLNGQPLSAEQYQQMVFASAMPGAAGLAAKTALGNVQQTGSAPSNAFGTAPGGTGAQSAFDNYLNSTGYQFQLKQGQNAIVSSNAAKGLLNSGATAKGLTQYGQVLASSYFDKYLQQLGGLSTQGLQASDQIVGAGTEGGKTSGPAVGNAFATAGGIAGKFVGGL